MYRHSRDGVESADSKQGNASSAAARPDRLKYEMLVASQSSYQHNVVFHRAHKDKILLFGEMIIDLTMIDSPLRGSKVSLLFCISSSGGDDPVLQMDMKLENVLKILMEHFQPKPEQLQKPSQYSSRITVMKRLGVSMDESQ
ncbi:hypothetical protein QQF64_023482 [Cirrhinus molitorella]|uniref:Uncharacterized protein n=1 Tax=Cirrhinus molitorella TaxID=172907 RepID=A0ABR3L5A9_9TELE